MSHLIAPKSWIPSLWFSSKMYRLQKKKKEKKTYFFFKMLPNRKEAQISNYIAHLKYSDAAEEYLTNAVLFFSVVFNVLISN